jgi:hypothetical protein
MSDAIKLSTVRKTPRYEDALLVIALTHEHAFDSFEREAGGEPPWTRTVSRSNWCGFHLKYRSGSCAPR